MAGKPQQPGANRPIPADVPRVSALRASWRLARFGVHGLHGLAVVLLRFARLSEAGRQARVQWWSAKAIRLLGITVQVNGEFDSGPKLIAANHLSWLDIQLIHAVHPQARFVSKAEVQAWPLVNRLVDAAGTLYLQRERPRDALRVLKLMSQALQQGATVAVFPEGTTGDGEALLPFHGNLLQAALTAQVPVQPVALRYSDARYPKASPSAWFVGEMTMGQSLWALASAAGLSAKVEVLELVGPAQTNALDRRALAETLRVLIDEAHHKAGDASSRFG